MTAARSTSTVPANAKSGRASLLKMKAAKPKYASARTGGACPFYKVRMAAQSAHILVVNHALLLADVITGSRVLPEYHYLIVDEAHHLESATTNALILPPHPDGFRAPAARDWRQSAAVWSAAAQPALDMLCCRLILPPSTMAAHKITDLLFRRGE